MEMKRRSFLKILAGLCALPAIPAIIKRHDIHKWIESEKIAARCETYGYQVIAQGQGMDFLTGEAVCFDFETSTYQRATVQDRPIGIALTNTPEGKQRILLF